MSTSNKETESELYRINNQLCCFSPNGQYFALAFEKKLIIKTQIFNNLYCLDFKEIIECLEWAPNSEFILCANMKNAVIQVYYLSCLQWKCRLIEGSNGLTNVTWSPDSNSFITFGDFNIQISIWNMENQTVSFIQNLKSSVSNQLYFSPNGERLAIITTDNGQDAVEIYKTSSLKISKVKK
ncbi:WD repeat-containing protein WRAP73-like [Prorops nasuta]|uniref:WD repeat-containing protein WRAP73-like n=1 Tax=Prorops nasuta TaxID=863751 RepID=UPI0034CEC68E